MENSQQVNAKLEQIEALTVSVLIRIYAVRVSCYFSLPVFFRYKISSPLSSSASS